MESQKNAQIIYKLQKCFEKAPWERMGEEGETMFSITTWNSDASLPNIYCMAGLFSLNSQNNSWVKITCYPLVGDEILRPREMNCNKLTTKQAWSRITNLGQLISHHPDSVFWIPYQYVSNCQSQHNCQIIYVMTSIFRMFQIQTIQIFKYVKYRTELVQHTVKGKHYYTKLSSTHILMC